MVHQGHEGVEAPLVHLQTLQDLFPHSEAVVLFQGQPWWPGAWPHTRGAPIPLPSPQGLPVLEGLVREVEACFLPEHPEVGSGVIRNVWDARRTPTRYFLRNFREVLKALQAMRGAPGWGQGHDAQQVLPV